jgi:hypothetical protein
MSFAAAIDAVTASRPQKARARLGMAAAAGFDGDAAGAAANSMAAFVDLSDGLGDKDVELADRIALCDREISLFEEIAARVAATGQGGEATAYLDAIKVRQLDAPVALWSTLLGGARAAHGERVMSDVDLEVALASEAAARPASRVVRLRLVERQLRRRYQDPAAREAAVAELHRLANQLEAEASPESNVELARVWFLLAAAYEDDQTNAARAEEAYRKGLRLRPRTQPR